VSTDDQAEKYGLDSQLRVLRDTAAARGYEVADGAEFVDDGYSGTTLERPQLERLRDAVRRHAYDVALTYSPDRLARDLTYSLLLKKEFRTAGVAIEYVTMRTDDTPAGIFHEQVLGAVAELERAMIKERTSRGRREKAQQGTIPGGTCPFGYRVDHTQPGGLAIDAEPADTIRKIFAWTTAGTSVRAIVSRLNAQGMPAPRGRWSRSTVRRILKNEVYAGTAHFSRTSGRVVRPRDQWIAIAVPPVVSPATFTRARTQSEQNQRRNSGRPGHRFYLLKGLLVCACGRPMHGLAKHDRRVYRCSGRDRLAAEVGGRCDASTRGAERLEALVWGSVVKVLSDPEVLLHKMKEHRQALDSRRVDAQSETQALRERLTRVERQLKRLLDAYLDEQLSKGLFDEKRRDLEAQKATLTEKLTAAEATAATGTAQARQREAVLLQCKLALRGLERLDDQGRQRLLRLLVTQVMVHPGRLEVQGFLGQLTPESPSEIAQGRNWADSPSCRPAPESGHNAAVSRRGPSGRGRLPPSPDP
jgi:site-specific DNA recombinase